jgi:hypothetical protein
MSATQVIELSQTSGVNTEPAVVRLCGVVDENTDMSAIESASDVSLIDISEVSRINGIGVLRLLRLRLQSSGRIAFIAKKSDWSISIANMLNG